MRLPRKHRAAGIAWAARCCLPGGCNDKAKEPSFAFLRPAQRCFARSRQEPPRIANETEGAYDQEKKSGRFGKRSRSLLKKFVGIKIWRIRESPRICGAERAAELKI